MFTPPSLSFLRVHEDKLVSLWSGGTDRAPLACRVRNTAVRHRVERNGTEPRRRERTRSTTPVSESPVRAAARRVSEARSPVKPCRSSLCCPDFLYVFISTVGNKFDIPSSLPAPRDHQYGHGVRAHGAGLALSPAHTDAKTSQCIIGIRGEVTGEIIPGCSVL